VWRQDPLGNAMPVATAALQSLWQHNMQALKVTRAFGAELLRTTGVVVITAVNYATGETRRHRSGPMNYSEMLAGLCQAGHHVSSYEVTRWIQARSRFHTAAKNLFAASDVHL
jgi:hypothetical protein